MLYRIEAGLFPHLDDTIGRHPHPARLCQQHGL